jgi:hypothetical protein
MTSNGVIGINLWPSKNQLSGRVGDRGNKIQILLDIDDFFSILFKETLIFLFFFGKNIFKYFFFEKNCPLKFGSKFYPHPHPPEMADPPPPWKKSSAHVCMEPTVHMNHGTAQCMWVNSRAKRANIEKKIKKTFVCLFVYTRPV